MLRYSLFAGASNRLPPFRPSISEDTPEPGSREEWDIVVSDAESQEWEKVKSDDWDGPLAEKTPDPAKFDRLKKQIPFLGRNEPKGARYRLCTEKNIMHGMVSTSFRCVSDLK
jgi:hypothetical protein